VRKEGADMGFAFDGDGDRFGLCDENGDVIWPDRYMILLARQVLEKQPGAKIIFDVKCTQALEDDILAHGGKPIMWKTGHSHIKAKLHEEQAALAGEMSGHVFFKERWYGFDDGLYTGARLLEILSKVADPSATLNALPDAVCTPELHIHTAEGENHALLAQLQKTAQFKDVREIITLDGLRVEYADGFGLARPSNTTPVIVLRFEADSSTALQRIQDEFREIFRQAAPHLKLPF
jgi:phosphomannomutase/phosphoglucomutase